MSQSVEVQQFAAFMRMFKNRVDRSYDALARRTGVSSSSLHRYCAGTKIPADYGTAQRFARECGATQPELRELHRLWVLANTHRKPRPAPAIEQAAATSTVTRAWQAPDLTFVVAAALLLLAGRTVCRIVELGQAHRSTVSGTLGGQGDV